MYVTDAAGRRLKRHAQRRVVRRAGGHAWRPGVDGGRRRRAANRAPGPVGEWHRLRNGDGGRLHLSGLLCRRKSPGRMRVRVVVRVSGRGARRRGGRCCGRSEAQDGLPCGRVDASLGVTDCVARESRRPCIGRLVIPGSPPLTRFAAQLVDVLDGLLAANERKPRLGRRPRCRSRCRRRRRSVRPSRRGPV